MAAQGIDAIKEKMTFAKLARRLGITRGAVSQWTHVPAERIGEVSKITGLPAHILRPDLFESAPQEPAE